MFTYLLKIGLSSKHVICYGIYLVINLPYQRRCIGITSSEMRNHFNPLCHTTKQPPLRSLKNFLATQTSERVKTDMHILHTSFCHKLSCFQDVKFSCIHWIVQAQPCYWFPAQCTEVGFTSFQSGGFTTIATVPTGRKSGKSHLCVQCPKFPTRLKKHA